MRTILIATLLLLTATPALADADWVQVAKNEDGTRTEYIDRSSISITGPIRRFWIRTDYVNEPHGYKQMRSLGEDNCASGQWRQLQNTVYKVDGTNTGPMVTDQSWSYVTPGTMGAAEHDYVCKQ